MDERLKGFGTLELWAEVQERFNDAIGAFGKDQAMRWAEHAVNHLAHELHAAFRGEEHEHDKSGGYPRAYNRRSAGAAVMDGEE